MSVVHVAVWVTDLETTTAFYEEALGLQYSRDFDGDDGIRNYFMCGEDGEFEIQFKHDPTRDTAVEPGAGALDHLAVEVDDIEAAVERVEGWDGEVTTEPTPPGESGVRIAFITDPMGNGVELVQPA